MEYFENGPPKTYVRNESFAAGHDNLGERKCWAASLEKERDKLVIKDESVHQFQHASYLLELVRLQ